MPSVRPKGNKPGPYGYFQRVLMDGARPFSYRPQTNSLLGQTTSSPVQQLTANQFTQTAFPYAVNDNLPDTTGEVMDLDLPGIVQPGPERHSPSALSPARQTAAQENGSPEATGEITLSSWLERAHASHGLPIQEEPTSAASTISKGNDELPYPSPAIQRPGADEQHLPEQKPPGTENGNQPVLSNAPKKHRPRGTVPDASGAPSLGPVRPPRPFDIKLAGKAQDRDTRRPRSGDNAVPEIQAETLMGATPSAGDQGTGGPQITSPPGRRIITAGTQNVHALYPQQPGVPGVRASVNPDTLSTARGMAKQQRPQSKPLVRPHIHVPAPNMPTLHQALRNGPVNAGPQLRDNRTEYKTHSTATPAPSNAAPRVQQRLVVINPPARSFSNRPAFWERSYLGRLGPRSYR